MQKSQSDAVVIMAGVQYCGKGSISKRTGESLVGQWLEFDTVTALRPGGLILVRELRSKPCDMAKKKKSKAKTEPRTVESCHTNDQVG